MKSRPEPGFHIEIGDFIVKLLAPDPVLQRRIQSFFPGSLARRPSLLTVEVFPGLPPAGRLALPYHRLGRGAWRHAEIMEGAGGYVAVFNPAARRAFICLQGPDKARTLANFIRRIYARLIVDHGGAVFHCAGVVRHGTACLFFGKSGAGKSTVCALARNGVIAADDLMAVRVVQGRLLGWGLPALGGNPGGQGAASAHHGPKFNFSTGPFPIKAAFTLVKDKRVYVNPLGAVDALARMLALPADLSDPVRIGKIIDLLTRLVHNVPCFELHFRKDRACWNEIDAALGEGGP